MVRHKPLTQEYLKSILHYDPKTGIFTWLKSLSFRVKIGDIAGSQTIHNYIIISFDKKKYYAHRLAHLYMNGEFPKEQVDHKDLNGLNNKWKNIRQSTRSQNLGNINKHKDNTSGYKGVWYFKQRNKWVAQIMIKGKRKTLGYFDNKIDASVAYKEAAENGFGEFART